MNLILTVIAYRYEPPVGPLNTVVVYRHAFLLQVGGHVISLACAK